MATTRAPLQFEGAGLNYTAFPLGGIGAGMLCMEGTGKISHVSVRNHPDAFNEPLTFAAVSVQGTGARVLEGPVQDWKIRFPWGEGLLSSANGGAGKDYGLPRFRDCSFSYEFPFGYVSVADAEFPVAAEITGWSPFIPGNSDDSSCPFAAMEYRIENTSSEKQSGVFYFSSHNFMASGRWVVHGSQTGHVGTVPGGFVLSQPPIEGKVWTKGDFAVSVLDEDVAVNCRLFRGGWFDSLTMLWNAIERGDRESNPPVTEGPTSPGGSLSVSFTLGPGESVTVPLLFSWYVPYSELRRGTGADDPDCDGEDCSCGSEENAGMCYQPWYTRRFNTISETTHYWREHYARLKSESERFRDAFYASTLPDEVIEAVGANLGILKSPTVLRQRDGRLWAWEGCCDSSGCCEGSCTHVWNYAQALPHLFPDLERTLRETEYFDCQDESGHQVFRAPLPIRPPVHGTIAAADGQLGGIVKVFRDWRIKGDNEWLRRYWPRLVASMAYCIELWDPDKTGMLVEPHHNTYDIEFWGPDGMCTSFYVAALKSMAEMAAALGEDGSEYAKLYERGRAALETELYNGEYFIQTVRWEGLRAGDPTEADSLTGRNYRSEEARALLQAEGPKYQYGVGCLSDGVLGAWLAEVSGLCDVISEEKVRSHLQAVHRYNFKSDLSLHSNPQRPTYALKDEAGLLLCSWPRGGKPSLPFVYSDEVWTGIEYQVASHLMFLGRVEEGLEIVRACRARYDGSKRDPFDEYECGHWYARAMASYGMFQGLTGIRYDAVEKTLYVKPRIEGDFTAFLSTEFGFGTVTVTDGEVAIDVRSGEIPVSNIEYTNPA